MPSNQPFSGFFKGKLELPNIKAHLLFWPLMVAGLARDLWTKAAVFSWLKQKPGYSVSIIDGFLRLVLAHNDGAAFGLFSGKPYALAALSAVALLVIIAIFLLGGKHQTSIYIALAFFAAGVCGNLYDRIFNDGFVRDFIDVYCRQYHWPAFNVADALLCIGVGVLHKSGRLKPHQEQ